MDILTAIRNATGPRPALFVPEVKLCSFFVLFGEYGFFAVVWEKHKRVGCILLAKYKAITFRK